MTLEVGKRPVAIHQERWPLRLWRSNKSAMSALGVPPEFCAPLGVASPFKWNKRDTGHDDGLVIAVEDVRPPDSRHPARPSQVRRAHWLAWPRAGSRQSLALGFLVSRCAPHGLLRKPTQIGLDVAVPQIQIRDR